jgi:hypothetical protein
MASDHPIHQYSTLLGNCVFGLCPCSATWLFPRTFGQHIFTPSGHCRIAPGFALFPKLFTEHSTTSNGPSGFSAGKGKNVAKPLVQW